MEGRLSEEEGGFRRQVPRRVDDTASKGHETSNLVCVRTVEPLVHALQASPCTLIESIPVSSLEFHL